MYVVTVKNILINKTFKVVFTSPYLLHDYLIKIKRSKKLKLLWIDNIY